MSYVIAIDGRCAAGKTTLANRISELTGAGVVHMDDFFLPMELRTKVRLEEPGGNVHYERFAEEVLPFLKQGRNFSYQRFDCSTMKLGSICKVTFADIIVVEGAYSCHPYLGSYMNLKVFADIDKELQLQRILRRNGQERLEIFKRKWIPLEEAYFSKYNIQQKADMIIGSEARAEQIVRKCREEIC